MASNEGFKYTQKVAKNAALEALQQYVVQTSSSQCCCNLAKLSDDLTTATMADGSSTTVIPVGSPDKYTIVCKIHSKAVVANKPLPDQSNLDGNEGMGYILSRDSLWFYIRKTGSAVKYYLPYTNNLFDKDPATIQGRLSSNGKGVLLGTVTENQYISTRTGSLTFYDPSVSIYFQFAHYSIFTDISLVSYTSSNLTTDSALYTYPVAKDSTPPNNVVVFKASKINSINVNSYAEDLTDRTNSIIPAPKAGENGSQALFYPYSTSDKIFNQFNPIINMNWLADTGYQFLKTNCSVGCGQIYGQVTTTANQNIPWTVSPNFSIFKNYIYTFNNEATTDTSGNAVYDADLVTTHVNCYLFAVAQSGWTESIHEMFDNDSTSTSCPRIFGNTYNYDETFDHTITYTYNSDFPYRLAYLPTPDIWIPETGDVNGTITAESWIKSVFYLNYNTSFDPCAGPSYSITQNTVFDYEKYITNGCSGGDCFHNGNECYLDGTTFNPGSQNAYAVCNTLGPGIFNNVNNFAVNNEFNFHYYSGLNTTTLGAFTSAAPLGTGCSYAFAPIAYYWVDINYDSLFFNTSPPSDFAVFGGRSSMVINHLHTNPTLYGIITQLLGDGNDSNLLASAWRGRGFVDNTNAAFVYSQNFNRIYRLSSPWLFQGNLTGISGTGEASLSDTATTDLYTTAIVQLVDWASLADAFGDSATASLINNLISVFRAQVVPSDATIDNVTNAIIAMDSDLNNDGAVSRLNTQLKQIGSSIQNNDFTVIGPDVIGYDLPDVYTDKIFSPHGQWPFPAPSGASSYFLKAPDSYTVQRYYILNGKEYIRQFNIATSGLTTPGKQASGKVSIIGETVLDYILPIKPTSP